MSDIKPQSGAIAEVSGVSGVSLRDHAGVLEYQLSLSLSLSVPTSRFSAGSARHGDDTSGVRAQESELRSPDVKRFTGGLAVSSLAFFGGMTWQVQAQTHAHVAHAQASAPVEAQA